jgi:Dolichyl-phosphate-mannose-protein mannosyltransferase
MPAHKRTGRSRRTPDRGRRAKAVATDATASRAAPPLFSWGLASLLIICFVLQCVAGMTHQSATYDEPVYIAAGYSYVETGDFRLKQDAPPLVATLGGMALRVGTYFGNQIVFDALSPLWNGSTEYQFAQQFFARAPDRHRTLQIARIPLVVIGAALAVFIFLFGRRLFGDYGALVPLFLFCFDPNMIAHSRIVAADAAWGAFFFIAHYYFYRLLTEGTLANLLGVSVAVALTIVAKFSGLLVFPSLALAGGAVYLFPSLMPLFPQDGTTSEKRRRLLRIGAATAVTSALATLLAVTAFYQSFAGVAQYVAGVRSIYTNGVPDFKFYLLGTFSPRSLWYYYPVAIVLKTPDVTLALLALACLSVFIPRSRVAGGIWLLVPVALVLAVSSQDPVNLGLRRILPVYPFLFLWIGERLVRVSELWPQSMNGPIVRWIPGAAVLLAAGGGIVSAIQIHPYQLAYFNRWAGGPAAGARYLDDSNIDWGQDLPSLAAWQSEHGVRPLALWYFGTDSPAGYGIESRPLSDEEVLQPRRDAYAISVNNLIGLKLRAQETGRGELDWLARYHPAATIGYSIYIYDFR